MNYKKYFVKKHNCAKLCKHNVYMRFQFSPQKFSCLVLPVTVEEQKKKLNSSSILFLFSKQHFLTSLTLTHLRLLIMLQVCYLLLNAIFSPYTFICSLVSTKRVSNILAIKSFQKFEYLVIEKECAHLKITPCVSYNAVVIAHKQRHILLISILHFHRSAYSTCPKES